MLGTSTSSRPASSLLADRILKEGVGLALQAAISRAEGRAQEALEREEFRRADRAQQQAKERAEAARIRKLAEKRLSNNVLRARKGLETLLIFAQSVPVQTLIGYSQSERDHFYRGKFHFFGVEINYNHASTWSDRDQERVHRTCFMKSFDESPEDVQVEINFTAAGIEFFWPADRLDNQPPTLQYGADESEKLKLLQGFLHEMSFRRERIADPFLRAQGNGYWTNSPNGLKHGVFGRFLMDCADPEKFERYCMAAVVNI
ncbi:MAG: hypothetical protein WDN67_04735 [Candidatus Moraniibacteriota bacterium]